MLLDLSEIIEECKILVDSIDEAKPVKVDPAVWQQILNYYEENYNSLNAILNSGTLVTDNGGQKVYISSLEFPRAKAVVPYNKALIEYQGVADQLAIEMGFGGRTTRAGKEFFTALPAKGWKSEKSTKELKDYDVALSNVLASENDRALFERFLNDPVWSGLAAEGGAAGRKLDRSSDWKESGILKVGGWVAAAATGRPRLVEALSAVIGLDDGVATLDIDSAKTVAGEKSGKPLTGAVNRIFYGAPGTGKSHFVDKLTEDHERVRTVFHPDIQNSDFVGALKPVMDDEKVTYKFSPGAFAYALAQAINNPEKHVSLIIEELNRAPAAAVFGELFLLLDRDENGLGVYDTNFPSEEFGKWLRLETGTDVEKLRLPSNLSIYATMNSADQGVYPLDTAFRRRWVQDYIEIAYENAPLGNVLVTISSGKTEIIRWADFVRILNEHLTNLGHIQEDRLVGPWFLKDTEISVDNHIPGKLLIYLWDDLLRHDGRSDVFSTEKIKTYGALSKALLENKPVFCDELLAKISEVILTNGASENDGV